MTVIDISTYQGVVNFPAVGGSGMVSGVIGKMGGGDNGVYVDSRWVANRSGIRAVGLRLGSYYFNGPGDTPTQAADFQFANMDWRPGDLAVIDVEGHGIAWTPGQVCEWAARMLWHGVPAADLLVYMSRSVENSEDWSALAGLGVEPWIADYGMNTGQPGIPPHTVNWPGYALWQYTSVGSIPGITGNVDMSLLSPSWAGGNVTPLTPPIIEEDNMPIYIWTNENPTVNGIGYALLDPSYVDGCIVTADPNVAGEFSRIVRSKTNDGSPLQLSRAEFNATCAAATAIWRAHTPVLAAPAALSAADIKAIAAAVVVPTPDLSSVLTAVSAVGAEVTALDTSSASYHSDLAATLAKGFTISGTAK